MNTALPIHPVVLCGGSGTRLWPLSRKALPKQFAPLVGGKSLLQLTLERLALLNADITCVTSEDHRFLVKETVDNARVTGRQILEPVARNTAAAMASAALLAAPDDLLLFAPSDHHIPDIALFERTVRTGIDAALAGNIVTFGVVPSFPSTAYGYIEAGEALADGHSHAVARFVEKPSAAVAEMLILQGGYSWNAGIFLVQARTLVAALREHAVDILQACENATARASRDGSFLRLDRAAFEQCRADSIDYAVLEKHRQIAVVKFEGLWSDVGSWNAVASLHPADDAGNRLSGKASALNSRNTFVHAPHRPVVALGTQDLIIVDTPDAVLVAGAGCAEQVAEVVRKLSLEGCAEATEHRRVVRPWGAYDSIDLGERFQVKRLTVKPGARLSLQMHHHRSEHWVVVKGTARATCDGTVRLVHENESIYLPSGAIHRLENPGKTVLEVIEVQTGGYLGEDDIVRFDDTYGRCAPQPEAAATAATAATLPADLIAADTA
ncbi:mannose-1-phosphate guanylyltransferase/mannose-6-phosphate isomerase [Variovorax atrisoli]|uniref:mannose-1-phosphate guanylyltransferase/mannose-6-phosphate isomerase n=1 Tax=Variovorax atrisoli TaxID=3394203 RepID=UPI000F7EE550|nr:MULTISPECIES: mannose-1-phosphate guanylyltransferase/mannose-6-phosphate isomerase [unclassified Variovorax]MBB3637537.1 mannose-1-phosphate guanylyltransferase/mannose-6-phosphate isomerase [Variovorax sp. BK613]RTD98040.1 mannose-1-phosphate guanylyltransferase/mannose-6-phosphate isomerase [Variovorax sp. 369]